MIKLIVVIAHFQCTLEIATQHGMRIVSHVHLMLCSCNNQNTSNDFVVYVHSSDSYDNTIVTIIVSSFKTKAIRTAWKSTFDRNKLNFRSQIVCYYQEPWISFIISNCHVNSIKCHMLKSCQKPRPLKKLGDNDRHSLVFFSSKMSCPLLWRSDLLQVITLKQLKVTNFFHDQLKVENVEMSTKRAKCSHLLFNSPLQRYVFKNQSIDDNHRSVKWLMFIVNQKFLNVSFCCVKLFEWRVVGCVALMLSSVIEIETENFPNWCFQFNTS